MQIYSLRGVFVLFVYLDVIIEVLQHMLAAQVIKYISNKILVKLILVT